MTAYLRLEAADPAKTGITLIDPAVPPGANPTVLVEPDWGNAEWEQQFSGPRGTLGAKVASQTIKNRQVALPLKVYGASKQDLASRMSRLHTVADLMRRYGGRITRRAHNQAFRQHLEVMAAGLTVAEWGTRAEFRDLARVLVSATCAPYVLGDPMDVLDHFDSNTLTDYGTVDAGAIGNVAVTAGSLVGIANLTTLNRIIHTSTGYSYGDHMACVQATPGSTVTNFIAGVVLKRISVATRIEVYALGTNTFRIDVNGTTRASGTISPALAAGVPFAIRARIEGNVVYAEIWYLTATAPALSLAYQLTAAEQVLIGEARTGKAGIVFTPQHASAAIDFFRVVPFVYGFGAGASSPTDEGAWLQGPADSFYMHGPVPGDVPAIIDTRLERRVDSQAFNGLVLGIAKAAAAHNMVTGGDFEAHAMNNWISSGVTGVTGAATSIAAFIGQAKYGTRSGQIVTPATANTGAAYRIPRRFLAGRTYVAMLWISSAAQVTQTRIRLGMNGDIASSAAAALTTTPTLRTVTWQPTARRNIAYIAAEVTAATATTMNIDGVCVFESRPAHLSAAIATTGATSCTVQEIPPHWPQAPFLALIDSELVFVSDVQGTTLTIVRGREGTTAATHAVDAAVHPLPPMDHVRGAGALPPFGVIHAANDVFYSSTYTVTPITDAEGMWGVSLSGTTGMESRIPIDPGLIPDMVDGDMVEWWPRIRTPATTGTVRLWDASIGSDKAVEIMGGQRYITPVSATTVWQSVRAGTVPIHPDRRPRPRESLLIVTESANAAIRHDSSFMVPVSGRVVTPTHKGLINLSLSPTGILKPDLTYKTIGDWRLGQDVAQVPTPAPIGGDLVDAGPGPLMVAWKMSYLETGQGSPFDNDLSTTYPSAALGIVPTPRWAILRDA